MYRSSGERLQIAIVGQQTQDAIELGVVTIWRDSAFSSTFY